MSLLKHILFKILAFGIFLKLGTTQTAQKVKFNIYTGTNLTNQQDGSNNVTLTLHVPNLTALESDINWLKSQFVKFIDDSKKRPPPTSCVDNYRRGHHASGIYEIQIPYTASPIRVYCMADPKGGMPWTVTVTDGYAFIGLDTFDHLLTGQGEPQKLWIRLTGRKGVPVDVYYDVFAIGSEAQKYILDLIRHQKGCPFNTFVNDNDNHVCSCVEGLGYYQCYSGFNGVPFGPLELVHMAIRPATNL